MTRDEVKRPGRASRLSALLGGAIRAHGGFETTLRICVVLGVGGGTIFVAERLVDIHEIFYFIFGQILMVVTMPWYSEPLLRKRKSPQ